MRFTQQKIFFSGIGGSGVSAIAGFMADKGHIVAGSDRAFDLNPDYHLRKTFLSRGIKIAPQDGSGLDHTFDLSVFSTAVEPGRPEVVKAGELGIPLKTRPEFLAELTASFKTIAVSGTSGKSTVSGMLAFIMERLGLAPNFIGGGRVKQFRTGSNAGNYLSGDSEYLIIEACESDGSIINYKPEHTIVLNLDFDHHPVAETEKMFEVLIQQTGGKVIINADDINLSRITDRNAVTFSLERDSLYKADAVTYGQFNTAFSVHGTQFSVSLPGAYNMYNALSCIALLSEMGVTMQDIAEVLPGFSGIDRRFDIYLNDGVHLVIDDYAHNPHKIAAMMDTMKQLRESVCYIFQPHGFGPTRMMRKEYVETFAQKLRPSDHLVMLPIYFAGGTAAHDIASEDLAGEIEKRGRSVEVVARRQDAVDKAVRYDTSVVLGARDDSLSELAEQIARAIQAGEGSIRQAQELR